MERVYTRAVGCCLVLVLFSGTLEAQDLRNYRWENRLVVLLTPDLQDPVFLRQLAEMQGAAKALKERKGVVLTVTPDGYATGLDPVKAQDRKPGKQTGAISRMDPSDGFRLVLLGLDGGIKLESREFVPAESLWALIDSMPMRQREMGEKGK
ncbi:DUF4174 domain-containing protein [Robiginitalea sp. SC105]|uniref:DUF4174 domain-containing protein n=1 Tax=Robiginitalea sp. SC105 TaxID=2762332 RepID=UPI00163A1EAB|nr:DUF4174 domain-containing protein [Robiginitalea sp. SC105]MBC2838944.1 DUF4174 domain-containing protein [Robiginitalea sp. SC105]